MDLMNLSEELKTGKIVSATDKNVTFLTPVCRASFPHLIEPTQFKGKGTPRFTLSAIFNNKNPEEPAHVDLMAVLVPELQKFAKSRGKNVKDILHSGVKSRDDGSQIDGYEEWTANCSFAKYPKPGKSFVPCYSPTGQLIEPDAIVGGYYVRVRGQVYVSKEWDKMALAIVSVQLIAKGPTFGADDADPGMGAIPGAKDIETSFDSATSDDDPDLNEF